MSDEAKHPEPDRETAKNPRLDLPERSDWGLAAPRQRAGGNWLIVLLLVTLVVLQVIILWRDDATEPGAIETATVAAPQHLDGIPLKDLSARLQRNNLHLAAARVLEDYLETLPVERLDERRQTLVGLGRLLMKGKRHEEAIVRFFEAELLKPGRDELQTHIDRHVKECMEKLGKHDELLYELSDRTRALRGSGSEASPGDRAAGREVARIGLEVITASDLDQLIAEEIDRQFAGAVGLPEEEREAHRARVLDEFQTPQRRLQKLQEIVARRILYREGIERAYDEDARVREELETMREGLVARQVVMKAMEEQIRISPTDLERFFQAESARYKKKEGEGTPTLDEVRDQVTRDYVRQKEAEVQQALIAELFRKHAVTIRTEAFLDVSGTGSEDGEGK